MTTNKELMTTTAQTPVEPKPAKQANVTALNLPADYMAQAQLGFHDQHEAGKKGNSARQRVAYAIMVWASVCKRDQSTPYTLDQALSNDAAKDALLGIMQAKFIIGKTVADDDDKKAGAKTTKSDNVSLVGRAFKLACLLARDGITFRQFNAKLGNFTIPSRLLAPSNKKLFDTLLGRLRDKPTVMLDNDGCAYLGMNDKGKSTLRTIRASVTQYEKSNSPPPKKRAGKNTTGDKSGEITGLAEVLSNVNREELANATPLATLAYALHAQWCKDAAPERLRRSDCTASVWAWMQDMAKRTHEYMNAPDWDDGKDAPEPKAARKPARKAA